MDFEKLCDSAGHIALTATGVITLIGLCLRIIWQDVIYRFLSNLTRQRHAQSIRIGNETYVLQRVNQDEQDGTTEKIVD